MAAGFPSSYIATESSAVTRTADSLSYDISGTPLATPQEMTVYVKLREQGSGLVDSLGVFKLGSNALADPQIYLRSVPHDRYGLFHDNGTSQVNANNTTSVSVGNVVELRAILHSDGSVQLGVSINGGSENLTSQSAANALSGSNWATETLWLNSRGGLIGFNDFLALTLSSGVKTMDEMRALDDASSEILFQTDFTKTLASGGFVELDMGDGTITDEDGDSEVSSMDTGSDFPWHLEPKRGEQQSGDTPLIEVTDGRGMIEYYRRWL